MLSAATMMNLLLFCVIGIIEWVLALKRTLACARGEKITLIIIVFLENILSLWVLQYFIMSNNWYVALAYSLGASIGALFVIGKEKKPLSEKEKEEEFNKKVQKALDSTYK
jgi:hypothetical protein